MHRWRVRVLLAGCAGVLLGLAGCSLPTTAVADVAASSVKQSAQNSSKKEESSVPFHLPEDNAGKLLGKVLPPAARPGALRDPTPRPARPMPGPRFREEVGRMDNPSSMQLARLPAPVRKDTRRPEFVLEEGLEDVSLAPVVPHVPSFATPRPARVESEDVSIPPPVPVLGTPVKDRVPVEDVTMEASTAAVLTAPLPVRTTPTPFVRLSVPDPFENRQPVTLSVPAEEASPVP